MPTGKTSKYEDHIGTSFVCDFKRREKYDFAPSLMKTRKYGASSLFSLAKEEDRKCENP